MPAIDKFLDVMLENGASDLHLAQGQPPKLRVHGGIKPIAGEAALDAETLEDMMREICSPKRWDAYMAKGDLDFAYAYRDKARFRANYLKQYVGFGAVLRIIPSRILSLEELGAPPILRSFAEYSSGLCLITGPTGSGKSTTLAAVIDLINSTQKKVILTIEEPIEFVHKPKKSTIIQREVGIDATSFGDALRAATRQDADVILVGEMRDLETIALAITAAEMGKLVFGTLHTNSATKTINRIVDAFPSSQQKAVQESLAAALRAVCAQLLLKRSDKPGRVACNEIMIQTRAISNLIREGKISQLIQTMMSGKSVGMQIMDDHIESLRASGKISGEEAYLKATDKDRFKQFAPNLALD